MTQNPLANVDVPKILTIYYNKKSFIDIGRTSYIITPFLLGEWGQKRKASLLEGLQNERETHSSPSL